MTPSLRAEGRLRVEAWPPSPIAGVRLREPRPLTRPSPPLSSSPWPRYSPSAHSPLAPPPLPPHLPPLPLSRLLHLTLGVFHSHSLHSVSSFLPMLCSSLLLALAALLSFGSSDAMGFAPLYAANPSPQQSATPTAASWKVSNLQWSNCDGRTYPVMVTPWSAEILDGDLMSLVFHMHSSIPVMPALPRTTAPGPGSTPRGCWAWRTSSSARMRCPSPPTPTLCGASSWPGPSAPATGTAAGTSSTTRAAASAASPPPTTSAPPLTPPPLGRCPVASSVAPRAPSSPPHPPRW